MDPVTAGVVSLWAGLTVQIVLLLWEARGLRIARCLVRAWTHLCTIGLPPQVRAEQLEEPASDLHEHQAFLARFGPISDHVRPRRHRLPAPQYRQTMQTRFATWREVTGPGATA